MKNEGGNVTPGDELTRTFGREGRANEQSEFAYGDAASPTLNYHHSLLLTLHSPRELLQVHQVCFRRVVLPQKISKALLAAVELLDLFELSEIRENDLIYLQSIAVVVSVIFQMETHLFKRRVRAKISFGRLFWSVKVAIRFAFNDER
jgi:hypothetical protein